MTCRNGFIDASHTCKAHTLWNPIGDDGCLFDDNQSHGCTLNVGSRYRNGNSVSDIDGRVKGDRVGWSGREYGS